MGLPVERVQRGPVGRLGGHRHPRGGRGRLPAGEVDLGADEGLLVAAGTGRFLVWRDHRLRVPDNAALAALGYAGIRPAEVGAAFLNALPHPDRTWPRSPCPTWARRPE